VLDIIPARRIEPVLEAIVLLQKAVKMIAVGGAEREFDLAHALAHRQDGGERFAGFFPDCAVGGESGFLR
jgi:hypothetical protein